MNRHFYGFPKGLPLENLARPYTAHSRDGGLLWQQNPSARIINDELFLSIMHILEGRAVTVRDAIDKGRYQICMHVATNPINLRFSIDNRLDRIQALKNPEREVTKDQGKRLNTSPLLRGCQDEPGFCTVCLTDYTTTVERVEVREVIRPEKAIGHEVISRCRWRR